MTITTTARYASLQDLAEILTVQHDLKFDHVVSATRLRSTKGLITVSPVGDPDAAPIGPFRPTPIFDGHVADKLGIPVAYVRRLRNERPDLYDANVNGLLHGGPAALDLGPDWDPVYPADKRNFLLRTFRNPDPMETGIARCLFSDSYRIIDNLDVLMSCLDAIRESGLNVEVLDADLSETRMVVRFVAPEITALAPDLLQGYRSPWRPGTAPIDKRSGRPGFLTPTGEPIVFAGLVLSNSETGDARFTLTPRVLIQTCGNGQAIAKDALKATHLGQKMDEGVVIWSDDTKRKNLELVQAMTGDAVRTFLNVEYMRKALAELTEKAGAEVANAVEVVQEVGKQLRYSEAAQAGILAHFIRGGQTTAGGVLQAITSYAQEVSDPDEAWDLERTAVEALDLTARLVRA